MPRLIRHPAPVIYGGAPSPRSGNGQLVANAARLNGGGYSVGQNAMLAQGLDFARQGMGQQFARQQHQQALYDHEQASHQALADAHSFLDDLSQAAPDVINDPDFRPFGAAIAHGMMHPKDAMTAYESIKKSKAERAAKDQQNAAKNDQANRGLDIRERGQQGTQDYRNARLGQIDLANGSLIDYRKHSTQQGQARNDQSAARDAQHEKDFQQNQERLAKTYGANGTKLSAAQNEALALEPEVLAHIATNEQASLQDRARASWALKQKGLNVDGTPVNPPAPDQTAPAPETGGLSFMGKAANAFGTMLGGPAMGTAAGAAVSPVPFTPQAPAPPAQQYGPPASGANLPDLMQAHADANPHMTAEELAASFYGKFPNLQQAQPHEDQ